MYLSKSQIENFVKKLGQPKASFILNSFFNSYRASLTSADVANVYDENYRQKISNHETKRVVAGTFKINVYNEYAYAYLTKRLSPGISVLDIGCGNGDFLLALASEFGIRGVGIDFDGLSIKEAEQKKPKDLNCRFHCEKASRLPKGERFDYVVMNDVVEHLSDGELTPLFIELKELLNRDGEILLHTPNGLALCNDTDRSFVQIVYKLYLKYFCGWAGFNRTAEQLYYDQVHINIKSFPQLRKFLSVLGFSAKGYYDECNLRPWARWMSSNMLVVARLK